MFPYLRILLFVVLVLLLYVFWEWGGANTLLSVVQPQGTVEIRPVGKAVPALTVQRKNVFSKKDFLFSELKGYPTIVHFWATWCAPCLLELPELLQSSKALRAQGYSVVAVAVDENWTKLDEFFVKHPELKEMQNQMILLLDPEGQIANEFGSRRFPETYLINDQLVIDNKLVGPQPWNSGALTPYIERLRTKK